MPKLGEIMRLSPETTLRQRLLRQIEQTPGQGSATLAQRLGVNLKSVSSALKVAYDRGYVRRKELDGSLRYYPANSLLGQAGVADKPKPGLVETAKDYVWETGANPAPIRAFVEWYARR